MISIDRHSGVIRNAVEWLREEYDIPGNQDCSDMFEKEFNCIVLYGKEWEVPVHIEFENDGAEMLFLLKWS